MLEANFEQHNSPDFSDDILYAPQAHVVFAEIYGRNRDIIESQIARYVALRDQHESTYGQTNPIFISSPGRLSLGGCHTDHNSGLVLAASLMTDVIACASKNESNTINIRYNLHKNLHSIDLKEWWIRPDTKGLVLALTHFLRDHGYRVAGLNLSLHSNLPRAEGLASSAAFENMISLAISDLYNNSEIPLLIRTSAGRYSEEISWEKISGELDQIGGAVGGINMVDFEYQNKPTIIHINDGDLIFSDEGYAITLVNTNSTHRGKNSQHLRISEDMKAIAAFFEKSMLREVSEDLFNAALAELYKTYDHRAVLRAEHFFIENKLVRKMFDALSRRDIPSFLKLMTESSTSAMEVLQNTYDIANPEYQPVPFAIHRTRSFARSTGNEDAIGYQPHGGGFGGTIMTVLKRELLPNYTREMSRFGFGVHEVHIREQGCINVSNMLRQE
ncbi:MAG: hypothetical protein GYA55_04390 [SAR324 cluster bacterium]|uniref:Galactokinase n=1 Tax=SAR324 cluster bacterium TaxID=2024889 RepID=A0A7X9FQM7_9DELT|nr:hypothetical protein [SAR324 cluster bacterium]